jgi:hypothetical protein
MELIDPGNRIPDAPRWRQSVADVVREQAELAKGISAGTSEHPRLLNRLADHVAALEVHDQRLRILRLSQTQRGEGKRFSGEWEPASKVRRLLATAGQGPERPSSGEFLTELAAASVEDLYAEWTRNARERSERDRQQVEQAASERIDEEVTRAQDSEAEARTELAAERARNANLQQVVDFLKDRVAALEEQVQPKAKAKPKKVAA